MTHRSDRQRSSVLWRTACVLYLSTGLNGANANVDADYERARHARDEGGTRPFSEILMRVAQEHPGEVLGVGLDRLRHHGHLDWIYVLKILAPDGRLKEIHVDGATARILDADQD